MQAWQNRYAPAFQAGLRPCNSGRLLHFLRHIQRLIELRIRNKRAVYWDLIIKDRISDYESEDVGSIPAGPAILRQ